MLPVRYLIFIQFQSKLQNVSMKQHDQGSIFFVALSHYDYAMKQLRNRPIVYYHNTKCNINCIFIYPNPHLSFSTSVKLVILNMTIPHKWSFPIITSNI